MTIDYYTKEVARLKRIGPDGQREEYADQVHHLTAVLEAFFRLAAGSEGALIDAVLPKDDRETRIAVLYGLQTIAEQARLGAEALANGLLFQDEPGGAGEPAHTGKEPVAA